MPYGETETHPYLDLQLGHDTSFYQLDHYEKMIVGTFPIYALSDSKSIMQTGKEIRSRMGNHAFLQYFYGGKKNKFWQLFCGVFKAPVPANRLQAIAILNKNHFIITDTIRQTERKHYSSLDTNLRNFKLNEEQILNILKNAKNLKTIYFTSLKAKELFYKVINVDCNNAVIRDQSILGKKYSLIELPLTTTYLQKFFDSFPLDENNLLERERKPGYFNFYLKRYYKHYLTV